jgi:murein L,D-transpeptidase YcbB/YkuD
MLGRYRQLASDVAAEHVPVFADTVHPGDVTEGLPALHRLLLAVGDLPAGTPPPASGVYDDTMRSGIIRFQERHGLEPDGVIGRATRAALGVPLPWRVRQIEMALERLRWLPDLSGGRTVAVNIPMYRLWAWDQGSSDDAPALTMPVIVGRALDTKTPVLAERLEHVIFRPYWNVPTSILRNEMLPILQRDPGYLDKQDLEIVQGPGDNATVLPPTAESIARLGRDGVRLRQRPGPKPQPIQVIIVYTTAVAAPDDGRMHFAEDVYGQDVVLDEALSGVRKTVQASPGADAPGVDVHEIRGRVVADAAPLEVERGRPQPGERHVGHANVDGLPLHVQAAGGDAFALLSQSAVRGGRPVG